jgi:hypothetical protein
VSEQEREPDEADPGFIGGGGLAEETEPEDEASEQMHRPDTDHGEF